MFRQCPGVECIARVSNVDGPFTGHYCKEANAEIAAKLLDRSDVSKDVKHNAEQAAADKTEEDRRQEKKIHIHKTGEDEEHPEGKNVIEANAPGKKRKTKKRGNGPRE